MTDVDDRLNALIKSAAQDCAAEHVPLDVAAIVTANRRRRQRALHTHASRRRSLRRLAILSFLVVVAVGTLVGVNLDKSPGRSTSQSAYGERLVRLERQYPPAIARAMAWAEGVDPDTYVAGPEWIPTSNSQLTPYVSRTERRGNDRVAPWYAELVSGGLGEVVTGRPPSGSDVVASFGVTTYVSNQDAFAQVESMTIKPSGRYKTVSLGGAGLGYVYGSGPHSQIYWVEGGWQISVDLGTEGATVAAARTIATGLFGHPLPTGPGEIVDGAGTGAGGACTATQLVGPAVVEVAEGVCDPAALLRMALSVRAAH